MHRRIWAATVAASLGIATFGLPLTQAQADPARAERPAPAASPGADGDVAFSDNLTQPWQERYHELRQEGLEQRLREAGRGPTERLGRNTFAKVAQKGTDRIFVVLAEFGDTAHSAFPDGDSDSTRPDGPLHNQIPRPDRKVDNSTNWQRDYDRAHYQQMYFSRMKKFYESQSIGRYSIGGDVTEWVKVPFNQARYGRDVCGDVVCNNTWFLIRDALAMWTQGKLDAGWSMTRIQDYLKTFDKQDRYDFDGDGNFSEPDGYIDHFQIVHAGGDQADGDPVYGEDAIWSHRWYAQVEPVGTGPGEAKFGGVNVGEGGVSDPSGANLTIPSNPTGVWVGDYTIQPENGGLSVFAHEFGHDLGLPDLYDTAGGDNSVEHWSLMAQSRGTAPGDPGIGDQPQAFGAWEKFQLGWLDYDTARAGQRSNHVIKPGSRLSGDQANALVVQLPDKVVDIDLGAPCADCGERYYYSGSGNDLDHTMTRAVDPAVGAAGAPLTAKVRYEVEAGYDYAYLETSSDAGKTWASVPTSESDDGTAEGETATDGISGSTGGDWVDLTATVPAGTNAVRWRYKTDPGVAELGFQVDQITLDGEVIGTAETGADEGWTYDGFSTTDGSETERFVNAYFVDNRQYVGQDKLLDHVYNFGFQGKNANRVEFFGYQPGALITYWDASYDDNNTSVHPGGGQILPVDAHPFFTHTPDGALARPKMLTYDSTFGLRRTETLRLHQKGTPFTIRGRNSVPVFDDTQDWWFASDLHGSTHEGDYQPGWYGVDVPKTGTTIRVKSVDKRGNMQIAVGRS